MIEKKKTPEAERLSEKLFSLPEPERDQYRADVERRLAKAAYLADMNGKNAEAEEARAVLERFVYETSPVLPGAREMVENAEKRRKENEEKARAEAAKAAAEKRPKFIKKDYGAEASTAHIQHLSAAKGKRLFFPK